jgi:hypothetical protein
VPISTSLRLLKPSSRVRTAHVCRPKSNQNHTLSYMSANLVLLAKVMHTEGRSFQSLFIFTDTPCCVSNLRKIIRPHNIQLCLF